MRKFLIFINFSVLVLLFSGCYSKLEPVKTDYSFFNEEKESQKFNTSIKFWNQQFSGITVIKKRGELWHIAMITEVGMKLFEFTWNGEELILVEAIEPLYTKNFIEILKLDFEMILHKSSLVKKKRFGKIIKYKTDKENKLVEKTTQKVYKKMGRFGYSRKITFDYDKDLLLKQIEIKNRGLNLQIELTPLN